MKISYYNTELFSDISFKRYVTKHFIFYKKVTRNASYPLIPHAEYDLLLKSVTFLCYEGFHYRNDGSDYTPISREEFKISVKLLIFNDKFESKLNAPL